MFMSEGLALELLRTTKPSDPRHIAAREYLKQLRKALLNSAASIKEAL